MAITVYLSPYEDPYSRSYYFAVKAIPDDYGRLFIYDREDKAFACFDRDQWAYYEDDNHSTRK